MNEKSKNCAIKDFYWNLFSFNSSVELDLSFWLSPNYFFSTFQYFNEQSNFDSKTRSKLVTNKLNWLMYARMCVRGVIKHMLIADSCFDNFSMVCSNDQKISTQDHQRNNPRTCDSRSCFKKLFSLKIALNYFLLQLS